MNLEGQSENLEVNFVDVYDGDVLVDIVPVRDGMWTSTLVELREGQHAIRAVSSGKYSDTKIFFSNPLRIDQAVMALSGRTAYVDWPLSGADVGGNTAVRTPEGGKPPYAYASNNTGIATVTNEGKVQGRANGTTRVVVSDAENSTVSYEVRVTNVFDLVLGEVLTGPEAVAWIKSKGGSQNSANVQYLARNVGQMYKTPFPTGTGWLVPEYANKYVSVSNTGRLFVADGSSHFRAWAFVPKVG